MMDGYERLIAEAYRLDREADAAEKSGDKVSAQRLRQRAARMVAAARAAREQSGKPMLIGEAVGTALNVAGEAATLGLIGDEAAAAADALVGRGSYGERLRFYRENEERLRAERPGMYWGALLGGPIAAAPILPGAVAAKGAGLLSKIAAGAKYGAGAGGVYSFMEGEGGALNRMKAGGEGMALGGLLSGGLVAASPVVAAATRPMRRAKAEREMIRRAPSTDDLKAAGAELYEQSAALGVKTPPDWAKRFSAVIKARMVDEGIMTPGGYVNPDYANVKTLLRYLDDFEGKEVTAKQLHAIRKAAAKVRDKAKDNSTRRLGAEIVETFDALSKDLVPGITKGNKLYSRGFKSENIERLIELANVDAANLYTGAGLSHALRRRFGKLHRDIVSGKERGWTADERRLIKRIAETGKIDELMRFFEKLSPKTGFGAQRSTAIGLGVGGMQLDPTLGAIAGIGSMGVGLAVQGIAARSQARRADLLRALAASGGKLPDPAPSGAAGILSKIGPAIAADVETRR